MFKKNETMPEGVKKAVSLEVFVFSGLFFGAFILLGAKMGAANMFNTLMNTAHNLLINTIFYIMSITVLAGAVSSLWSEFGLTGLFSSLLAPLMKPLYGLPGASAVSVVLTYLSDNLAVLTLTDNEKFRRNFKKYHVPALCNLGTSFGMGLIITICMVGLKPISGESLTFAVVIGNVGAIIGSIISTRLMLWQSAKFYGKEREVEIFDAAGNVDKNPLPPVRSGDVGSRFISALLDGGKNGVDMGLSIIPGVLIICTLVMMLTNGMPVDGYTGAAYEGIALLPWLGDKLSFLLTPLFGFSSAEGIAVPITAVGSAGAAIGTVEKLLAAGLANAHDVAVFTAMCVCMSGYMSTHVDMMDGMRCTKLTGKAIIIHTIGGLCAGIAANWIYNLLMMIL